MDKATSAAFDRLTSPFDDPQLKKELSGMAKAAEAYEKQFAALKPQIDQMSEALAHQARHMEEAFKRAGLL